MSRKNWLAAAMICLSPSLGAAKTPVAVSPGDPVEVSTAASACPTFHWSAVREAFGYELVVYRVDGGSEESSPALRESVPGSVTGWTPPLESCLERGEEYAWSVRALRRDAGGDWSMPNLFRVPAGPTRSELEQALVLVNRYLSREVEFEAVESSSPNLENQAVFRAVGEAVGSAEESVAGESVELAGPLRRPTSAVAKETLVPGILSLFLDGDLELGGLLLKEGAPFLHNVGGNGLANTGLGINALAGPDAGCCNTALGHDALLSIDGGSSNVALGVSALSSTTKGKENTAIGAFAMQLNQSGDQNTAVGTSALQSSKGNHNVGVGFEALKNLGSATANTAVGKGALGTLETGTRNVGLGLNAGSGLTSGSDNIYLLSLAASGESNTLRIGQGTGTGTALLNRAFISGIRGVQTAKSDAQVVLIDSLGQLGTISSSRRFKEAIRDMGETSSRLFDLRPVTFRYRKAFEGDEKPVQFGLIAEEVAEVFPELVVYDELGRPETVKYHLLSSLLLAELQKLEAQASRQGAELAALRDRLRAMQDGRTRGAR